MQKVRKVLAKKNIRIKKIIFPKTIIKDQYFDSAL